MTVARNELDRLLDALATDVSRMVEGSSQALQRETFNGIAEQIRAAAGPEDVRHVWSRLQCIQRDTGLIPGDDKPCSDGEKPLDDDAVSQ